jgi:hypothetical protein
MHRAVLRFDTAFMRIKQHACQYSRSAAKDNQKSFLIGPLKVSCKPKLRHRMRIITSRLIDESSCLLGHQHHRYRATTEGRGTRVGRERQQETRLFSNKAAL